MLCGPDELQQLTLEPLGFEILTCVPIPDGFAPIGLLDKFNSAAFFQCLEKPEDKSSNVWKLQVQGGGTFGFYSETEPQSVSCNGQPLAPQRNPETELTTVAPPGGNSANTLEISLK